MKIKMESYAFCISAVLEKGGAVILNLPKLVQIKGMQQLFIQQFNCIIYQKIQLDKWEAQAYTKTIKVKQDV